jgi:hypothetical protein
VSTVCRPGSRGKRFLGHRERRETRISLEPLRPRTFDKTSPVTAYWLPRCDGFQVVGGRRSTVVEGAVFDDDPRHPVALRVRHGHNGRKLIPIDAVEAVCPLGRVLYIRRRPSVAARAGVGVVALGAGIGRVARTAALLCAALWRFVTPRVRVTAHAALSAGRAQWPSVRRGVVVAGETAFFLALAAAMLVASASVMGGRLVRAGFRTARRYAPRGARAARRSFTQTRRVVAARARDRVRKTPLAAAVEPLADPDGAELLDRPLRTNVARMHEKHDRPHEPKSVAQHQGL